jgi:hypothetical protein
MRHLSFLAVALISLLSPGASADSLLYDWALNTTPCSQGWYYGTDSRLATQSASGGVTTFSTTAANSIRAGYSTRDPITSQDLPGMPALDRISGYTIQLDVKIDSE